MAQLKIDLNDAASIALGLTILNSLSGEENVMGEGQVEDINDLMDAGEADDLGMDDLLDEPEAEPEVTLKDVQNAFRELAKAKGKDPAVALVKKALAKMGVAKMEEIAEEKRKPFIAVLNAAAKK